MTVSVILHDTAGATDAELAFIRQSVALLREAVQAPGFGGSVRQADYSSASWQGRHGNIRELDGEGVWDRIVHGRESGHCGDHALNLSVEIADLPDNADGKGLIGATRIGTLPIFSARWFLARCMAADDRVNYAAHLMHQWMHVSGFVHKRDGDGRDAPSVVSRLVRRTLEPTHGEHIDAQLTALVTLSADGCDCCRVEDAPLDARAA
jgi:hypothetical protein